MAYGTNSSPEGNDIIFLAVTTGTCDLVDVYALNPWILVMHIRKNNNNSSLELIVNVLCL